MSSKNIHQEITSQVERHLSNIDDFLGQKPIRKSLENDVMKELKKLRKQAKTQLSVLSNKQVTQDYKKTISNRQKKIKQQMDKVKPMVMLSTDERNAYRQQIANVIKQVEKKITALYEKKDNKKRQQYIQFFKYHQNKLTTFIEWLMSPSRQFSLQHMKTLMKYLNDLQISHQDIVFQEQIEQIYQKIVFVAQQPQQVAHQMFVSSFENRPKINDYLPSKQTKQTLSRNSICPHYKMIDLSVMSKVPKEVLFFMFYFHKNQTEQYLAAKQLMKHSWRYYKKFHIWIKRGTQPTFEGAEYETGNYMCVGADLAKRQKKGIKIFHRYLLQEL